MKRRGPALLPKREVLRRTQLAPATLAAMVRSRAFPAPVHNGRWDPAEIDRWTEDARRNAQREAEGHAAVGS